jgi:Fe-S-cluster containining protein
MSEPGQRRNTGAPDILQGLLYAHTRANLNTIEAHQAQADVQALIEVLIERGVLDREEFDAHREAAAQRLRAEFVEKGMSVAIQEHETSKYEFTDEPEIDCASRVHLCKAACCRLSFALSKEDVEEGVVRWELGRPYMIAQTSERRCVHLDGETQGCGVYEQRPFTCRKYDCRNDLRVWEDFEGMVPNAQLGELNWPACVELPDEPEEGRPSPPKAGLLPD